MKILNELVLQDAMIDQAIQFESHERVPYALIETDSVLIEQEATEDIEAVESVIVDTYATVEVDGQLYCKIDSTGKNQDGTFNFAEPTYSTDMATEKQKIWAEQFELITHDEYMEIRRIAIMTAEEYREYVREQLEAESKPVSFTFTCSPKGTELEFCIDNEDRVDLLGQMAMGLTEYEIHDLKRLNSDTYNQVEVAVIMTALATVTKMHKYPIDAKIKALYELEDGFTQADVNVIVGD